MSSPIIRTNNVAVVYGEGTASLRALDGVSIEIFPEEYIIFYGPSGCGKSTLLYTIAGLERATEGSVTVVGKDIEGLSREEMVHFHRNTIGMVFQAYYLIPSLSVLQNVALPQIFASRDTAERETHASALLKRFGILEQAQKLPTALSGGQQQRVAIARSLANDAPLILADEPVGNLDSKSADVVLELLKDLNKTDKKTVIMVTHNPNHLHYADRVFYMKDGKVVREVRNENVKPEVKKEEPMPMMNFGLQEYAKLFPHLSEEELKAKMLTSYVLGEIDIETEEKLEKLVGEFMRSTITDEQFIHKVTRPIKKDGLGLYHAFAERLIRDLKQVLGMANYLVEAYGSYPKTYEAYDAILTRLTDYLYAVTEHKPTPEDVERVKKVLKSRLEGSIDHDGFQEFLDKPEREGGAGLNIRTARNFARQFELILLGFEERARKHSAHTTDEKPHLFGMKTSGSGPSASSSQPIATAKAPSSVSVMSTTPSSTLITPEHTTITPQEKPHAEIAPPLKIPTQKIPAPHASSPSTDEPEEIPIPPHAKTIADTIEFFPTTETPPKPSAQDTPTPSMTAPQPLHKSTPPQKHEGFLSTLTHMIKHDAVPVPPPPAHIPTPPSPHANIPTPPPRVTPPAPQASTTATTAQHTAPITNTPPPPAPPRAPSVPRPPTPFTITAPSHEQRSPMIFPQKLHSFTQEKHESR